jgi:hypoxanthine phosphoribosyltransferase
MKVIPLISEERILNRVKELAAKISQDYKDKRLIIVGILKGSFVFMSDLIRRLTIPCRCDFVKLSSYGGGTQTSGKVRMDLGLSEEIKGLDVLVVEDIVDTGLTLDSLKRILLGYGPGSLKFCTLLDKPSRRKVEIQIDYIGFEIEDRFVVGYGLDFDEEYRHLPFIGYIEN